MFADVNVNFCESPGCCRVNVLPTHSATHQQSEAGGRMEEGLSVGGIWLCLLMYVREREEIENWQTVKGGVYLCGRWAGKEEKNFQLQSRDSECRVAWASASHMHIQDECLAKRARFKLRRRICACQCQWGRRRQKKSEDVRRELRATSNTVSSSLGVSWGYEDLTVLHEC